jgi:hypothetical protein
LASAKTIRSDRSERKRSPSAKASAMLEPNVPPAGNAKLVRDSFTIPKDEYVVLDELKERAARLVRPVKKGELLRAGIAALKAMPDRSFLAALSAVPSLKPGRPKRDATPADSPKVGHHHRKRR